MIDLKRKISNREVRQFAALCAALCAALAVWSWSGAPAGAAAPIWGAASVMSVIGIAWPSLLRPVYVGWIHVAFPIGWLVSHAVLAAVFYGLVTPIGLLMRWLGHDSLGRSFDRSAATYWAAHDPGSDAPRYFRQF